MQVTMGTSAAESLNAAGNIFIGQVRIVKTYDPKQDSKIKLCDVQDCSVSMNMNQIFKFQEFEN